MLKNLLVVSAVSVYNADGLFEEFIQVGRTVKGMPLTDRENWDMFDCRTAEGTQFFLFAEEVVVC